MTSRRYTGSVSAVARCGLSALVLVLVGATARAEVTLSGTATFEFAQSTGTGDPQKFDLRLEPVLNADLPEDWTFTTILRLRGDAYDRLEPGEPKPLEMSSLSRAQPIGNQVVFELREFYVQGDVGPALLTIGKQQVVWGQADGLKVLDVVNPQYFREFILPEFEESRRGSVATHLASTTFCWLPPDSWRTRCSPPLARIPKRSIMSAASLASLPRSMTKARDMRSRSASETFSRIVIGRMRP